MLGTIRTALVQPETLAIDPEGPLVTQGITLTASDVGLLDSSVRAADRRELIKEAALAARALVSRRSQAVAMVVHNIADPYFSEIVRGIEIIATTNLHQDGSGRRLTHLGFEQPCVTANHHSECAHPGS